MHSWLWKKLNCNKFPTIRAQANIVEQVFEAQANIVEQVFEMMSITNKHQRVSEHVYIQEIGIITAKHKKNVCFWYSYNARNL